MMIPKQVQNVPICTPIQNLLFVATDRGYTIIKEELRDYHFQELYFELEGDGLISDIAIPKYITHPEADLFACTCHWSTVKLVPKFVISNSNFR